MARPNLKIEKTDGNLGIRSEKPDAVTAVVLNGIATPDLQLGEIYKLKRLQDAEDRGLDKDYDAENKVLVYHRIKRLFAHNPSIEIHLMVVAQDKTLAIMVDKEEPYLAKLLRSQAGKIVQCIVARNPLEAYVPTIDLGLNNETIPAAYKAQELINQEFTKGRYSEIFIEGRNFTGTVGAVQTLRELVTDCPDVSIVIMADNDISKSDPVFLNYAAVEDFGAMVSKAAVSQNAGELIPDFNLQKKDKGIFLNAGLSSGKHIDDYTDGDLDGLDEKGYVFATATSGIAGYHINDTHTCIAETSDYSKVENNRTIKKAIKLARTKLLPKVKGRLYVDPNNGEITPENRKELEAITEAALDPLFADRDISGGVDAYIAPGQNLLATSKLEVQLSFTPVAIGREITLKIGFNNPLKK